MSSPWRKSSFSSDNGTCVEVAVVAGRVGVRDSKAPQAGAIFFSSKEMAAYVEAVKTGRFDR